MDHGIGQSLPVWSVAPFLVLVLSIATFPLFAPHFWERNRNKAIVSLLLAIPTAVALLAAYGATGGAELRHALFDYASFIALIGSLFIISGGIHIGGSLSGAPIANTGLLAIGVVLANFIGTTGASVLLIRPLLRANKRRKKKAHIVIFFIFSVSNCAGMLTPLGDPPLFLGFLKGVPFEWTLQLWQPWLLVNGLILLLFSFVDQVMLNRQEREVKGADLEAILEHEPIRIGGAGNAVFLLGVILVLIAKGQGWGANGEWPFGVQEALMVGLAAAAYLTTPSRARRANEFTFSPIIEVAVLFLGIFVTMIPPLQLLNAHGAELGLVHPWQYFWYTGILSSFLDNAPTYLTFAASAAGTMGVSVDDPRYLGIFLTKGAEAEQLLRAVSCGAVMMGANTYIGNGPNFMVKAIAEEAGVRMPSFFGYMRYSGLILIPIFIVVTVLFFL